MILLSFDIEEFDIPLEHGVELPFCEQIRISSEGTTRILDCLKQHKVKATFFCTANFALHAPEIVERIVLEGHEIASHGYYHSSFEISDIVKSKEILEKITGIRIYGYRQARMKPVGHRDIMEAGYAYNSSLNPTFIPGRYLNLFKLRTCHTIQGVLQIPVSVTPFLRFPLFWLSYHTLPANLYRRLCRWTHRYDGHLTTYFHPWEYYPLSEHPEFNLPYLIRKNSGKQMEKRLNDFIHYFKQQKCSFNTYYEFYLTTLQTIIPVKTEN